MATHLETTRRALGITSDMADAALEAFNDGWPPSAIDGAYKYRPGSARKLVVAAWADDKERETQTRRALRRPR